MFPYPDFLLKKHAKISINGLNPQTKYTEFLCAITHNKNIISHKNRFVKGFL